MIKITATKEIIRTKIYDNNLLRLKLGFLVFFILFVDLRREEFYKKITLNKKNYKKTVLSFKPQNHINITKFTFKMHIIYSYV